MSSENIHLEPHVLKFINQIDEPSDALARRPVDPGSPINPTLRLPTRKLSEPGHKLFAPLKPILKTRRCVTDDVSAAVHPLPHPAAKSSVPLRFATRKMPPPLDPAVARNQDVPASTVSSDSGDDLFYTPGSFKDDSAGSAGNNIPVEGKDYFGAREKNGPSESFYADPPTPIPTPTLRSSFSQNVPYQGYPLTPRNTIRRKRKTLPIVDELDRHRSNVQLPSRASFTFSTPLETPSPREFPLPPVASANSNTQIDQPTSATPQASTVKAAQRRVSWRPSLPAFTRRSQDKITSQRPEPERVASKRKSNSDGEVRTKRRKVVQFDLPPEHKEHAPMRRRPTPYYEPLSKIKRMLRKLIAPFYRSKQEKEQEKATKATKKAVKKARKEREELLESYRHFDDTVD